jgi:protein ImuB
MRPTRVVAVWCPDLPVVVAATAEGVPLPAPVAVVAGNRVVACSAAARMRDVHCGQRRREAQGHCPELVVLAGDPDRDARAFEPVAAAVESLAPGVEVVHPGLIALPARGPVRYFGNEVTAAERIVEVVAARTGVSCRLGIADGLFAAILAAQRGKRVPPGGSASFLAPLSIAELHQPVAGVEQSLVDLLHRLGLRTLGAFAALPVDSVASRFGRDGVRAHQLARGRDERVLARRRPPADLTVTRHFDPPLARVDTVAFASQEPAQQLHTALAARGLACVRLDIGTGTETGEELHRVWRCAEPLSSSGIADRVRWQLDSWLTSRTSLPQAGITLLRLTAVEVVGGHALQRGLWGDLGEADERASRVFVRVQGMLGPEAVLTGVLGGGRDPTDRVRLVPWGEQCTPRRDAAPPWPGRLPAPSPSLLPECPPPAEVLDESGCPVTLSERATLTAVPARIAVGGTSPRRVVSWAGPWPVAERWWEPGEGQLRVWLQVVLAGEPDEPPDGRNGEPLAVLLAHIGSRWEVAGIYD